MRRGVVLLVIALAIASRPATAAPWVVTAEGGAELDSNVQRVETGPMLDTAPVAAGVMRLGGKLARRDKLFGGTYGINLSALARFVAGDAETSPENVVYFASDVRWMHPVGDRPLAAGVALIAADAVPVTDGVGARTFANLGADTLLALRDDDDRVLTLAAGAREFTYKPQPEFDWSGPTASVRLDLALWQSAARTHTLELGAIVGFELRDYAGKAFADACAMAAPRTPACFAPTSVGRIDRYHRAGVELTWTGEFVASVGYQVVVIASNSYGQSLIRHRAQASVTRALPFELYGTLLAIVQLDTFLDGLVVETDPNNQSFTSLDDENRSSLQLRLGRPVSDAWSIEARAAIWRNLGSSDNTFERELVYAGVIYQR
jgi:hypothetical protein